MRTTIDLPDEVFRNAKARAALRGMKLKEYVEALCRQDLAMEPSPTPTRGRGDAIPVRLPAGRLFFAPETTNADLFEALDREEEERLREVVHGRDD